MRVFVLWFCSLSSVSQKKSQNWEITHKDMLMVLQWQTQQRRYVVVLNSLSVCSCAVVVFVSLPPFS